MTSRDEPMPCLCAQFAPTEPTLPDYCELIQPGDERALCETQGDRYRLIFQADNTPITLCCFEKYIDARGSRQRKTDFLAVGRHNNETYVIFIELRKSLVRDRHWQDKAAQIEEAVSSLCKGTSDIGTQHHAEVADAFSAHGNMQNHKIVGVVIPVDHSRRRLEQHQPLEVGGKRGIILAISPSRGDPPTLNGSDMLKKLGIEAV